MCNRHLSKVKNINQTNKPVLPCVVKANIKDMKLKTQLNELHDGENFI